MLFHVFSYSELERIFLTYIVFQLTSIFNLSRNLFWKLQKYSLRNPKKFENLADFDLFHTNCWNGFSLFLLFFLFFCWNGCSDFFSSKIMNFGPELKTNQQFENTTARMRNVWRNLAEFLIAVRCLLIGFKKCKGV